MDPTDTLVETPAPDAVSEGVSKEPIEGDFPADHLSKNQSVLTALEWIYIHACDKEKAIDWACRNDPSVPADWGALL